MADVEMCQNQNLPIQLTVQNCQHQIIKVKKKYFILRGFKKCAECQQRWCGAKCTGCGKPVHRQCADKRSVIISSLNRVIEHDLHEQGVSSEHTNNNIEQDMSSEHTENNNEEITKSNFENDLIDDLYDESFESNHVIDSSCSVSRNVSVEEVNDSDESFVDWLQLNGLSEWCGFSQLVPSNLNVDPIKPQYSIHEPALSRVLKKIQGIMYEFMYEKYCRVEKLINLSHFYTDERFRDDRLIISSNKSEILYTTLRVIHECIQNNLYGLSLSNNMLDSGDGLVWIHSFFPDLKILDLSSNMLTGVTALKGMSGMSLEWLYVNGNPVKTALPETPSLTQEIQKIFPELRYLDNMELVPLKRKYIAKMPSIFNESNPVKKRKLLN